MGKRAKEFYNTIRDVNISRGDNRDGIIAACVYFACRDENVPRSTKEIAGYFDIKLQDMTRGIKKFRENWRLANPNNTDDIFKSESSNPIDFIERYCSNLPIETNIKHISENNKTYVKISKTYTTNIQTISNIYSKHIQKYSNNIPTNFT